MAGNFVINEQTVIEFEHQSSQLPECVPNIFKKDAERMLLGIRASRLTLKDAEDDRQPASVHFVGPIDFSGREYFLSAIHRALGFALDPLELDLHPYAYDEEVEEDRDLAKITDGIMKMLEEMSSKGPRLLYLSDVTRFTLPEVQTEILGLIGRLAVAFEDCVVLLLDTNKPPKQLVSRLQSHKVVLEQFQPAPLDHQQRKVYLRSQVDLDDAALDSFKWTLGGFELEDLERVCIEFRFLRSSTNPSPFDALHRAIETAKREDDSRGKHLQMLGRGLCSWPEIKGYEDNKAKLQNHLYGPLKKPEIYARYGVNLPSGILLHGPSGCGKSMAIQAIANDGVFSVLEIRLEHLLSKYFGETEERLRDAFWVARQSAPCILFVDGIEGLGQRRGIGEDSSADTTGVSERLLSTLLNEMDGIEGIRGVIVVGTTTSPELLDSALLRPGRLDLHFGFGLPTADDRLALIVSWASRFSLSLSEDQQQALIEQTDGLSCADIVQIFQQAGRDAIHRDPSDPVIKIGDLLDRFKCE
jgi:AAA+ superfamily predicted ATPase